MKRAATTRSRHANGEQKNMHNNIKPPVRSAHPVEADVRETIQHCLDDIETQHGVKILFACESGSRAWGFASPDSDYDVRFIYVQPLSWYLSVEPQRDVIELPIDSKLDVNGWELRKALRLLSRSNPPLSEWLDSPVIYREQPATVVRLRTLAVDCFSPLKSRYHYLAMAQRNFRDYLRGERIRLKKYLYVLRPLLAACWVDAGLGQPPTRFADLVAATIKERELTSEIDRLLEIKMLSGEAQYGPRWPVIHAFIEREMTARDDFPCSPVPPRGQTAQLDRFLQETVLANTEKMA